jgi:hypothetical protein
MAENAVAIEDDKSRGKSGQKDFDNSSLCPTELGRDLIQEGGGSSGRKREQREEREKRLGEKNQAGPRQPAKLVVGGRNEGRR